MEANLLTYIAQIIHETRNNPSLFLGASPRASVAILNSAKAFAALNGRDFVTPEDIKVVAHPVLRHRVILTPDKEMEGITADEVVKQIVDKIEVPR
jgi:MoxR-like ATPase